MRKDVERSVEAAWQRIGSLPDDVLSDECANYLKNTGYGVA